MIRKDREITDINEIISVMEGCDVCRIALNDENGPYIVPLCFGVEKSEDKIYIYFHGAAKGKKNCLIASNSVAGFEADRVLGLIKGTTGCGCTMQYESVSGKGVLETLSAVGEKEHALKVILEHYFKPGILPMVSAAVDATNVMRMKVTEISGKRFIKSRPASKC